MLMLQVDFLGEVNNINYHVQTQDHQYWINFNRKLDADAGSLPNEASIEKRLDELMKMEIVDLRLFWLTIARIAELALKQAGDYADNCEFQVAGDLLVNPRQIDIYLNGWADPIVKHRHSALSVQFAASIGNHNPVVWLSRKTCPRIRTEALLPFLEKMLSSSSFMNPEYLAELEQRLCKVADAIAFLMAWQIEDSTQLYRRIQEAGPDETAYIISSLCHFDNHHFEAMGDEIESVILKSKPSNYLIPGGSASN